MFLFFMFLCFMFLFLCENKCENKNLNARVQCESSFECACIVAFFSLRHSECA